MLPGLGAPRVSPVCDARSRSLGHSPKPRTGVACCRQDGASSVFIPAAGGGAAGREER